MGNQPLEQHVWDPTRKDQVPNPRADSAPAMDPTFHGGLPVLSMLEERACFQGITLVGSCVVLPYSDHPEKMTKPRLWKHVCCPLVVESFGLAPSFWPGFDLPCQMDTRELGAPSQLHLLRTYYCWRLTEHGL